MLDRLLGGLRAQVTAKNPQKFLSPLWAPIKATSGVNVDEDTALTYSAVWSAVKTISETIAMLPWRPYAESGDTRTLLAGSGLDVLLHKRPNGESTPFTFREYLLASALLHGNGYAEIERNRIGEPIGLHPIHPLSVAVERDASGALYYRVRLDTGSQVDIAADDMYHLRGPTRDGVVGRSVLSLARESFGLGIASERFAGGFFGNAGVPSLALIQGTDSPELSKEGLDNLLASFERRHGGARNAGKPALLESGWTIQQLGIPQKDAQFIESRQFSVGDVARWFRLPPHKIGDLSRATFSNIEEQNRDYINDAILPWCVRLEQEAAVKLIVADDVYTRIDTRALLRGNSRDRSEYYTKMRDLGVLSINEIRALEDLNPIDDGDLRLVPLNMVSLDRARQDQANQIASLGDAITSELARLAKMETNATAREIEKKSDLTVWAHDWFSSHQGRLIESLSPLAAAVGVAYGKDAQAVRHAVIEYATIMCERSIQSLTTHGAAVKLDPAADATRLIHYIRGLAE